MFVPPHKMLFCLALILAQLFLTACPASSDKSSDADFIASIGGLVDEGNGEGYAGIITSTYYSMKDRSCTDSAGVRRRDYARVEVDDGTITLRPSVCSDQAQDLPPHLVNFSVGEVDVLGFKSGLFEAANAPPPENAVQAFCMADPIPDPNHPSYREKVEITVMKETGEAFITLYTKSGTSGLTIHDSRVASFTRVRSEGLVTYYEGSRAVIVIQNKRVRGGGGFRARIDVEIGGRTFIDNGAACRDRL